MQDFGGEFADHLPYKSWFKCLKGLVELQFPQQFNKENAWCLGTHTLRKTGYLFAVWGIATKYDSYRRIGKKIALTEVDYDSVLRAARHKTMTNASKYVLDACTLFELVQAERFQEDQKVSHWNAMLVVQSTAASAVTIHSRVHQKESIAEQANWYYENDVVLPDGLDFRAYYNESCKTMTKDSVTESALQNELKIMAEKAGDASGVEKIMKLMDQLIREKRKREWLSCSPAVQEEQSPTPPTKKSKNGEKSNPAWFDKLLMEFKACHKAKHDKAVVLQVWAKFADSDFAKQPGVFETSARNLVNKYKASHKKILQCIDQCHRGNAASFHALKKWPSATKYVCKCKN